MSPPDRQGALDAGTRGWSALLTCIILSAVCRAHVPSDEVTSLPGFPQELPFRHYSGYLNVPDSVHLHYWFFESARDPFKDPLVLWLNGGPGCSSLAGAMTENGPFRVGEDGETLKLNPFSWNRIANVLYLETPVGVGYSYSDRSETSTDDDKASIINFMAIKAFYKHYPEFYGNHFYMFGESYASVYISTLAMHLIDDPFFMHFMGIGIGNGLLSMDLNLNSGLYFAYQRGFLGTVAWSELMRVCCTDGAIGCDFVATSLSSSPCKTAVARAVEFVASSGLNNFNILDDCLTSNALSTHGNADVLNRSLLDLEMYYRLKLSSGFEAKKPEARADGRQVKVELDCTNSTSLTSYLNDPRVRRALHIADAAPRWEICSDLNYTTLYTDLREQFLVLLFQGKEILLYHGDVDLTCNFLGGEWFTDRLQQPMVSDTQPWYITHKATRRVAGFYKQFTRLKFVTIKGGGHQAPKDKPEECFHMFATFLSEASRKRQQQSLSSN